MRIERRSPPTAFGVASPCTRSIVRQRTALEALTPKRIAACRHDRPDDIAANTRVRRSRERDFGMSAGLHPGRQLESLNPRFVNPPPIQSERIMLLAGRYIRR